MRQRETRETKLEVAGPLECGIEAVRPTHEERAVPALGEPALEQSRERGGGDVLPPLVEDDPAAAGRQGGVDPFRLAGQGLGDRAGRSALLRADRGELETCFAGAAAVVVRQTLVDPVGHPLPHRDDEEAHSAIPSGARRTSASSGRAWGAPRVRPTAPRGCSTPGSPAA